MKDNPLSEILKILWRAARDMLKDEATTASGRINMFGMLVALAACLIFGVKSLLEEIGAATRSVIYNVDTPSSDSALPYLSGFLGWTFLCMIIGLVDRRTREHQGD